MGMSVCLCVCLSICLSDCSHNSKTVQPNFTKFFMLVALWPWLGPLMALRYVMYFRFMDDAIISYRGTDRQNQARCYVVRQVVAPVDVAGHEPLQPTVPLARQAVLLGRRRTRRPGRGAPVIMMNTSMYSLWVAPQRARSLLAMNALLATCILTSVENLRADNGTKTDRIAAVVVEKCLSTQPQTVQVNPFHVSVD